MTQNELENLEIRHAVLVMKHIKILEIIGQRGHSYKASVGDYTAEQKGHIREDIKALTSILTLCPPELLRDLCKLHEKQDDDRALFLSFVSHLDAALDWAEACFEAGCIRAESSARKQPWWKRLLRWFR